MDKPVTVCQTQPASLLWWGIKEASRGVKGEEENDDEEEEEGKEEG
jgi:hypothetical protein